VLLSELDADTTQERCGRGTYLPSSSLYIKRGGNGIRFTRSLYVWESAGYVVIRENPRTQSSNARRGKGEKWARPDRFAQGKRKGGRVKFPVENEKKEGKRNSEQVKDRLPLQDATARAPSQTEETKSWAFSSTQRLFNVTKRLPARGRDAWTTSPRVLEIPAE